MRREEDPGRLEMAVPSDQRPVNELQGLKQAQLYSWATLPIQEYVKRLAGVFVFFYAFVGGPISYQTFDPFSQPVAWALSASVGSLVVVAIVVVRIFLGWQYVGDRLMSAAVDYEETGWYDGEVFVKPPEVLTRDRLLGMYEVKPVMAKLRSTLIGSGSMLLVCAVILSGIISATSDDDGVYGRGASMGRQTSDGVIFSKNVKDLAELKEDDDKAAEEARAAGGVPGYCRDRVLRAAAGGQFCEKFNL